MLAGHTPTVGERAPASLRHAEADAAEAVGSYRDRYGPRRDPAAGEHGALLGSPPPQSAADKRRSWYQRAIDALRRITESRAGASERRGLPEPAHRQPAAPAVAMLDWSDAAEYLAPQPMRERAPAPATEQLQAALEDYLHPEPDLSMDL